jgi:catechol-2,3-dioxygenase
MTHLIRQIGCLTLVTPDLDGSAADLSEIVGLKVTGRTDRAVLMSCNERSVELAYVSGERPGVLAIGLETMDDAAFDEARRRITAEGFPVIAETPLWSGIERAFRFKTPFGPIFELHTPAARKLPARHVGTGSRPRRLEHVNLRVSDPHGFRDMLTGTLGMMISDRTADDEIVWYRAWDGYHHTIAAGAASTIGGLHHYAFDAYAFEDLVGVADTLVLKGRTMLWGPGRHGAGDNIFTYYVDPNGCIVETSVGMARIDNDVLYHPRTWGAPSDPKMRNLWGPPSPADFGQYTIPFIETFN